MPTPLGHLAVLAFHGIDATDRTDPLTVTPAALRTMLSTLRDSGVRLVGLTDALAAPEGVVAVTFDDGYAGFGAAAEVLAELDAGATLYLPSDHVGGSAGWLAAGARPLLAGAEVAELAAAGRVEIGCHGATHAPLDTLPAGALAAETVGAKASLEELTGRPVVSFAYPHGYWHGPSRDAVEAAGFANACVLGHGLHRVGADPFAVRRLLVSAADTPESLARRIDSARPTVRGVASRVLAGPWRGVRKARDTRAGRRPSGAAAATRAAGAAPATRQPSGRSGGGA